jgi:phospholipid/cholesterol/gamma-HCH transport system substrate-binding protein
MKIRKEVKIGITVVVAVAFLIYGVNYLKGIDLFKKRREFIAVYSDINGLVVPSPVIVSGMKVGQVTEITFIEHDKIIVKFSIDNKSVVFPKDSRAIIFNADLLGTRAIDIKYGKSDKMAQPGDTLVSDRQVSMQEKIDAQIAPLKFKIESLLGSLDTLTEGISGVIGGSKDKLKIAIDNFATTGKNLSEFTTRLNQMVDETGKITATINKIDNIVGNIQKSNNQITKVINNTAAITDTISHLELTQTINKINKTMAGINSVLESVNKGEGTLGSLIKNDSLYKELVKTNDELNRLLENIREHPNRYVHFSVFGRKDKGIKLDARDEKKLKQILKNN